MFNPNQRRYLGSKTVLLDFINSVLDKIEYNSFCDLFGGTGVVGFNQIEKGKKVILNDFLFSNYAIYKGFSSKGKISKKKIVNLIEEWNNMEVKTDNYFSKNFGNKYFGLDTSRKIGFIREELNSLKETNSITKKEFYVLLASVMFSMDRSALTVGHYDAYRKGAEEKRIFNIEMINYEKYTNEKTEIYNMDANIIAREINSDVVYLDPPYNSRQYGDAYHLLENFAKWEKPETFGVAAKMNRHELKSEYSMKDAIISFETLVNSINSKYIIVSYNDTGIAANSRSAAKMSDKDILRILKNRGKVSIVEKKHKAFNTGKTKRANVKERLFICKVNKKPTYKQNLKSPLNYMGGKYQIIDQLKSHFPKDIKRFYDVFAGGLNVGINSEAKDVFAYDIQPELIEVLNYIKNTSTQNLISGIERNIKKFNLSYTAKYSYQEYNTNSSNGLATYNKEQYLNLRNVYNKTKKVDLLLTLIIFGFNNMIRFNAKGQFNTPIGKRDFNASMRAKMVAFSERLKDLVIVIDQKDFRSVNITQNQKNDLYFLDPPYYITNAVYNYSFWTEKEEIDLYKFIEKLLAKGKRFVLTNALSADGRINKHLENFIERNKELLNIEKTKNTFINSSYNKKMKKPTIELIIKNY